MLVAAMQQRVALLEKSSGAFVCRGTIVPIPKNMQCLLAVWPMEECSEFIDDLQPIVDCTSFEYSN